jgi:opacity protein-like surface antigen
MTTHLSRFALSSVVAVLLTAGAAAAQDAAPAGLTIELNEIAPSEKGCKLTFVAGSALAQSLSKVSFEFVLFDQEGRVERMAVLDFRDLPAGKTKVRQFDLPGTKCEAVKSLLVNDAPACVGEGVDKNACMTGLKTGSRSAVELKG